MLNISSRGGLEVELWSDNRTLSILVDQSPLWALNIVSLDCGISIVYDILLLPFSCDTLFYFSSGHTSVPTVNSFIGHVKVPWIGL